MKFASSLVALALLACGPVFAQEADDSSSNESEESSGSTFAQDAAETITDAYNIVEDTADSYLNQAQEWFNEGSSDSSDSSGGASQQ
ncbi:MAG: hypothetical protein ACO33A_04875 [Hyphomonas sp.]